MKKPDLCVARQKLLVPVPEYPGAYALVPPPTPRLIPLPKIQNEVARAHEALGALKMLTEKLPRPDLVVRQLASSNNISSNSKYQFRKQPTAWMLASSAPYIPTLNDRVFRRNR
jgi:hypothetical protein